MLNVKIRKTFERTTRNRIAKQQNDNARSNPDNGFTLDVEFIAAPGVTILFGASGSGKTLTLKCVAGLIRPDTGYINISDQILFDSTLGADLPIRLRHTGYVFQNLALFPHLSALDNVAFSLTKLPRRERSARALSLLRKFNVDHAASRLPRDISGGEAQRVALARALASEPRLLLLDEPLSALDDPVKLDILSDLLKINRELQLPILYVTHSRDEALMLGQRALIYECGRIVADGEPAEVFSAPLKASVARLTGVENVFKGRVKSKDEVFGTMAVELDNVFGTPCLVEIPLGKKSVGERVIIAVRSADILLATAEPHEISARNVLAGRLNEIEDRSDQMLVRVSSGVSWAASVTKQSVRELGLTAGQQVWLIFKTYSCRTLDE